MPAGCKNNPAAAFDRSGGVLLGMWKQKTALHKQCRIYVVRLDSPLNLVGTETSGTSVHMARSTVNNSLNAFHIGLPGTIGTSVGVGNLDTEGNALATIITLCHSLHLLSVHDGSLIYAYKQALEYDSRVF